MFAFIFTFSHIYISRSLDNATAMSHTITSKGPPLLSVGSVDILPAAGEILTAVCSRAHLY